MLPVHTVFVAFAAVGLAACTPSLDWREFRSAETGIALLFPCRPSTQERTVSIAGQRVRLKLHACRAGDTTFAMAEADVGDPSRVADALVYMRDSAIANLAGRAGGVAPFDVPGATPNSMALRGDVTGNLPDGRAVTEHLGVFAVGTVVAQVTALGSRSELDAIDSFFESTRVRR